MKMLTAKETAASLKISLSMVYRLISTGELPSYAIGGCLRINESDLLQFLDSRKQEPNKLPESQKRHF